MSNGYVKYLIAYDVSNDKLRKKIFDSLKELGLQAVQNSVFVGELNQAEFSVVKRTVMQYLADSDKCLWFPVNFTNKQFRTFPGYENFNFLEHDGYDCI